MIETPRPDSGISRQDVIEAIKDAKLAAGKYPAVQLILNEIPDVYTDQAEAPTPGDTPQE